MFRSRDIPIIVNVYDLHQSNGVLRSVGAGFYHTGVEVNGYEYSFSEAGVSRTQPRLPAFGTLREQVTMGHYSGGMGGINAVISQLRNDRFQPGAYHPVHLNCNHFSEAFCQLTVHASLPEYINRLAQVGSNFVQRPAAGGSDQSMAAPGVVNSPKLESNGSGGGTSSSSNSGEGGVASIFNWLGWGSSSTNTTTSSTAATAPAAAPSKQKPITNPKKKKELTDKQKELLSKMKNKS